MAEGYDNQAEHPQEPGAPRPPAGAPASPRSPFYRSAANDAAQSVPTPPGPFVRPAHAAQPYNPPPVSLPEPIPADRPQGRPVDQPQQAPWPLPQPTPPGPARPQPGPTGAYPAPQLQPAAQVSMPANVVAGAPAPRPAARNSPLRCPNCSGPVSSESETCPTCGEQLNAKPRVIRCRQCGQRASSRLTICPHCGRELRPAPSRLLTIGLPLVLGALLLVIMALQSDSGNPLGWVGNRARAATAWVSALSARLDPQLEVIPAPDANAVAVLPTAPVGVAPAAGAQGEGALADGAPGVVDGVHTETAGPITDTIVVTAGQPVLSLPESVVISATAEAQNLVATATASALSGAAVASVGAVLTTTPSLTPPTAATEAPQPTATFAATATPAPTNSPAPVTYTVVQGDAAQSIAARFGVTLDALLLANNLTLADATLLQPGQTLTVPLPGTGSTGVSGTPAGSVYTVRAGDTLVDIAARTGVPLAVLQAANNLSNAQAASLQPGDTLVIPAPTPAATATAAATATPVATATPAATVTPAAVANATETTAARPTLAATVSAPNGMRHPAPVLRAPQDGATVACAAGRLEWEPTTNMGDNESYRVHLGFVSGRDTGGNLQITWLIQQDIAPTVTQVGVPADFCDKSSDEMGNQWRWYVEVVTKSGSATLPVSPTSAVWGFAWKD